MLLLDGLRLQEHDASVGPVVIFDATGSAITIGSSSSHMAASLSLDSNEAHALFRCIFFLSSAAAPAPHPSFTLQVQWGIMGGVTSIPAAYSISFALACAPSINAAVHAYGRLLTSSRPTTLAPHSSGPELQLLGYATDNGAYYYYQVRLPNASLRIFALPPYSCVKAPVGGEYSATLTAVVNKSNIPYRYLQLDSWRYFKV
jgi:hypothetical protein